MELLFYLCRDGTDKYFAEMSVTEFAIHPNYVSNPSIYSGHDIAIALVETKTWPSERCPFSGLPVYPDYPYNPFTIGLFRGRQSTVGQGQGRQSQEKGMPQVFGGEGAIAQVSVCGYPKEVQWAGEEGSGKMFGMDGHGQMSEAGNLIVYRDIDTSGGQSGSPVIHERRLHDGDECDTIVGVHVGGNAAEGCNVATAITADIKDWIVSTMAAWGVAIYRL